MKTVFEMNKELYPQIPDFDSWSEDQLNEYIDKHTKDFVIENRLTCYEDGENLLKRWLSKDLISEENYNAFIYMQKRFWLIDKV